MISKSNLYLTAAIAGALSVAATATAQTAAPTTAAPTAAAPAAVQNPMVGGVAMDATKSIVVNAATAPNLSTLVAAVKAAGLATTLSGPGPFTVFAPTNDAFTRLAPGTVENLLKPENKATLAKVLTYHVVPGTITFADLQARAKTSGGKVVLTTVEGEPLTLDVSATAVQLTDVNGNKSFIETPDVKQSNGVVHVVNGVVLPKLG
ncbi:fasciclin domain-containing protein [Sphingomonas sp.]|uniref:fasciclin domain-containing protein n=1 Tax=Sphingomonas sp. TaxID=28214 RepID=UPI00333FB0EA